MLEVINPQKEVFIFHFGGLSLTNNGFALNSIVNRIIELSFIRTSLKNSRSRSRAPLKRDYISNLNKLRYASNAVRLKSRVSEHTR